MIVDFNDWKVLTCIAFLGILMVYGLWPSTPCKGPDDQFPEPEPVHPKLTLPGIPGLINWWFDPKKL